MIEYNKQIMFKKFTTLHVYRKVHLTRLDQGLKIGYNQIILEMCADRV